MTGRIPGNLREAEFDSKLIGSIESSDGEVHLGVSRFHFSPKIRVIFDSFPGDISE